MSSVLLPAILAVVIAGCTVSDDDAHGAASPGANATQTVEPSSRPTASSTSLATTTTLQRDQAGGVDGPVMYAPKLPALGSDGIGVPLMDALISGTLARDGNCLYLAADTLNATPLLWMHGTRWEPDSEEVVTSTGVRIGLGTDFSAGGGTVGIESLSEEPGADLTERVAECAPTPDQEFNWVQHSVRVVAQ